MSNFLKIRHALKFSTCIWFVFPPTHPARSGLVWVNAEVQPSEDTAEVDHFSTPRTSSDCVSVPGSQAYLLGQWGVNDTVEV